MVKKIILLLIFFIFTLVSTEVKKYVRFYWQKKIHYGILEKDHIHLLSAPPFLKEEKTGKILKTSEISLLPPVAPKKVFAVALNYRSHGSGVGVQIFLKLPTSVSQSGKPLIYTKEMKNLHYEGEMVLIIGKKGKNIPLKKSREHIFAVTVGNDFSERTWQFGDTAWFRGKASDGFAPLAMVMVTGLNYNNLLIETKVNGERKQYESTKGMVHSAEKIVSFISKYATLEVGDIIFTGTPGSTSSVKPGDIVEVTLEKVGSVITPIQ